MSELKPCPFCGGDAAHKTILDDSGDFCCSVIECQQCGAESPGDPTEKGAADSWNRRVQPPEEKYSVCTCPSGDGSLSWPCPVHPPVSYEESLDHAIAAFMKEK